MSICPFCRGAKHVRTHRGWTRCSCVVKDLAASYIKPKLKRGQLEVPKVPDHFKPWTLEDLICYGDYGSFCDRCWLSLISSPIFDLHYDVLEASRLVEIYLSQDPEYPRVRDLEDIPLIILALGVAEPPNKMLAPLVTQLLTQRRGLGRPTWLYSSTSQSRLVERYGYDLANLMRSFKEAGPAWSGPFVEPESKEAKPVQRLDPRDM